MKPVMILFFFLLLASVSHAQRGVRLTSRYTKRQKFISEGSRVIYSYIDRGQPLVVSYSRYGQPYYPGISGIGILQILNDSTIQVDKEIIKISTLTSFGLKKEGASVGSIILVTGGFSLIMIGAADHAPDGESNQKGTVLTGLACMLIGFIDAGARSPKSTSTWKVEVVK